MKLPTTPGSLIRVRGGGGTYFFLHIDGKWCGQTAAENRWETGLLGDPGKFEVIHDAGRPARE